MGSPPRARRSTQRPSRCWLRRGCPVSGRAPFATLEPHVQTWELKGCRDKPADVAKSCGWAHVFPLARVLETGLCTPRLDCTSCTALLHFSPGRGAELAGCPLLSPVSHWYLASASAIVP